VAVVVLASFLSMHEDKGTLYLELFAGKRRLCRLAHSLGYPCAAHDILYDDHTNGSSMDVNSNAGFLLLC